MTIFRHKLLPLLLALLMVATMLPMTALAAEIPDEASTVCTDELCTHDHEETEAPDVYDVQPDTDTAELSEDIPETETQEETPEMSPVDDVTDVSEETPAPPANEEPPAEGTPVPEETEAPEAPPVEDEKTELLSGYIGDSFATWTLNNETGRLLISGDGYVEPFYSPDEQPWREMREQITSVRFDLSASLEISDLCYWFDGCINLSDAGISVYVSQLAPADFTDCASLYALTYGGVDVLDEITADYDNQIPSEPLSENGAADSGISLFSSSSCGILQCTCKGSCQWGYRDYQVAPESNNYHIMTVYCSTCGRTDGIIVTGNHSYNSRGNCTYCGYYNSAYDQTAVCYHTSTYKSWSGCNWTKYCSNCGAYISSGTSHGSTYTSWNGCNWYDYCRDCGQLMDFGTSHSYSYGGWEYYNNSRHSRTGTCTSCGTTTTSYGYHSTSTQYSPYSSTQHSYGSYCSTCGSYVGSVSYASHSFSYGSWQNYNGTQHRRLKTCSTCGYSEYEYSNHSLSYGSWTNYSASQHRRTVSCSTCGYSGYEYTSHSITNGAWSSISATQHRRTLSCSCGYNTTETASHSLTYGNWQNYNGTQHRRTVTCTTCGYNTYEYANHSLTYGVWTSISETQHQRTGSCSCGYSTKETGSHADASDDGYCDDCEYLMTRFSVTVPASLSLTVSEHGAVYSANNAAIVNNSTGAIEVTGVAVSTANGWTLAPYSSNMANAKVDSKLIGFSINGAQSAASGTSENLSLSGAWSIAKGASLPLTYDAVVSALSKPVSEQVLTVVFVLDWTAS